SVSTGAFRGDSPSVRFNQRFADGKSETQTSQLCAAALFKSIENFRERFRLNSQAAISDLNTQLSIGIVARGNKNLPFARRKLHCVIYQIPKDLLEPRRVRSQMDILCAKAEFTRQIFSIDFRMTNLKGTLQQRVRVNDFKIELHLAFINAR